MVRVPVRFALQPAEVGKLFTAGGQVFIAVGRFADRTLLRARSYAPERTGKLKRSLRKLPVVTPLGVRFQVGTDVDYAEAVHEGTPRHIIRARDGGVLAFTVNGRKAFARYVVHPGSEGNPFLRRALDEEVARGL